MNNWFSKFLAETNEQGRNAFRVVVAMMSGIIPALPLVLYIALQSGAWQVYVVLAAMVCWGILLVVSAGLARQNRANLAMALVIGGVCVLLPVLSALISGLGLILSITEVLSILIVTGQNLSGPRAARAVIAGAISAVLTLLIDLFATWGRVSYPLLQNAAPFMAVAVVLALGAYIIRQFSNYSLRTKLLLGVIALTVLSVGILALVNYTNTRSNLTSNAGAGLKSLANSQAAAISNVLIQETHVLQSFDLSKLVQDRVDEVNAAYGPDQALNLQQIQLLDKQWRAADAANNDKDPLVSAALNSVVASELTEFKDTFPENAEVFVTDKYGALIAATNRTSDYYQADEDWWQAAFNDGKGAIYFGQPEFDESSKTFGIILAVPIVAHGSNEVTGVVRTTVNIDSVLAILNADLLGGTGHTDLYLPGNQALAPEDQQGLRPADPQALANLDALVGNTAYDTFTLDGIPSVVSAAQVTSADPEVQSAIKNLGWTLIVDQSQADNQAPVTQQTRATVLIALLILAVATAASIFLAQTLTSPIVRLTAVASEIAGGNLTAQARVESNDEIGTLALTFNNMSAQLKNTLDGLELRVAERTQSLELASEVGRSVSQVRALDVMLTDATELIRSRFDLYYVQVYLTDPTQTNLLLFSGTGKVGTELLSRNHRLPLNTGSINGRAATEKRSVVIADTTASATFRPNPLLPNTRSEMAVPLIVGDKVVGVLDLQSEKANSLNQEILSAFEALAGQLAIAIQNATLLAETNQARAEVEAQAKRLSRANWADYMDAIHKPEQTGFVFEQNQISAMTQDEAIKENSLVAPIAVTGAALGNLIVEMGGQSQGARTAELVDTIARQVAQQIESLRLLESAERYRAESEEASRRITREGWQEHVANTNENISYYYDLKEVLPYKDNGSQPAEGTLNLPLKIRDEIIGKLSFQGLASDDTDSIDLANAVAERLGAHIESLRQFDETQRGQIELDKRAQQLAAVAEISTVSSKELDINKMLESVASLSQRQFGLYHAHIFTYNENTQQLEISACGWEAGSEHAGTHEKTVIALSQEQSLVARAARTKQAVIVNDVQHEEGWLPNPLLPDTASEMAVPLVVGDQVLGVLDVQSNIVNAFTAEDANIQTTLASQVATALQNARSFARAQQQADRESTLNVISQKIQSATTVEAVLQIAARELGHALGAPMTVAQLSMKDKS